MTRVVAGIDVGSIRKGFHCVGLSSRKAVGRFWSTDPVDVANWCVGIGATVVGVDAPIRWSRTGRARPAELALMRAGISCFASPSEEAAMNHPRDYYGWMRNGAALYGALGKHFNAFDGRNDRRRPIAFETFPHAIACALAGRVVPARSKRTIRRTLLKKAGVACELLTNIDFVDAALCALAAECFARRRYQKYGEPGEGYIVVPDFARQLPTSRQSLAIALRP